MDRATGATVRTWDEGRSMADAEPAYWNQALIASTRAASVSPTFNGVTAT